jgi:hypothetical protein
MARVAASICHGGDDSILLNEPKKDLVRAIFWGLCTLTALCWLVTFVSALLWRFVQVPGSEVAAALGYSLTLLSASLVGALALFPWSWQRRRIARPIEREDEMPT